jgi:hypothetical protein
MTESVTIRITLGNASMQTAFDVARALERVARQINTNGPSVPYRDGESFPVKDTNGNTVGEVTFKLAKANRLS